MFAVNVAINLPVKNLFRQFTYSVPEALQFIDSGWRVVIPFSGQKVEGFVVERVSLPSDEVLRSKLKPVEAALGDTPWFDKEMLATAKWMADYYMCSLAEAMRPAVQLSAVERVLPSRQRISLTSLLTSLRSKSISDVLYGAVRNRVF